MSDHTTELKIQSLRFIMPILATLMLVTDVGDDVHVVAKFNMMVTDFAVFLSSTCSMLHALFNYP